MRSRQLRGPLPGGILRCESIATQRIAWEDPISVSRQSGNQHVLSRVSDAGAWRATLHSLPHPHVLQTWEWGEVKSRWGWRPLRLRWDDRGGRPLAAASALERRLGRLPLRMLYVPKGPLLNWGDARLATQVLADLEALARQREALVLKIDPDVFYPGDALPCCGQPHAAAAESLLESRGWRFSSEQVQFRNTALLSLAPREEDLLAAMKPKTRYNVRLAQRRQVSIRRGGPADLNTFYEMYAETARRDGFLIRPAAYYLDAWTTFLGTGLADLLLAEVEEEPVAGLMLFRVEGTAWYLYGASIEQHRSSMPNYLLQWEAIRRARAAGCMCYDLWGAPDHLTTSDPLWGVWRFKAGFGAGWARGLGAWDYAPRELTFRIYAWVLPRYVGWLQKRYRLQI